ncbi:Small Conductance Mechanosensitive Ion Channel (MscS) Family, partial [Trachipleistophora hominis]
MPRNDDRPGRGSRHNESEESEGENGPVSVNIRYPDESDEGAEREHESVSNEENAPSNEEVMPSRNRRSDGAYSIINRNEPNDEEREYLRRSRALHLENDASSHHQYDTPERRGLHDSDSTLTRDSDYNALGKEPSSKMTHFFRRVFVFFDRLLEIDFIYFFLGSVIILLTALCIPADYTYTCFQKEEGSDVLKEWPLKLRPVFFGIAIVLFIMGCIASVIYYVAQILLKYLGDQDGWFATFCSLNCHIAMLIILITLLITFMYKRMANLQFAKGTNLDISHVLSTLLFANFLLTLKTFILKKVSLTFNYSTHLNRVRLILLDEYFKNFLKGLRGLDSIGDAKNDSYWKNFLPYGKHKSQEKAVQVFERLFVDDLKKKETENVLLTEFSKIHARPIDPFKNDQASKEFWLKRSKKIYAGSNTSNSFNTINDFAGLFASRELFERFCVLLKIKPRDTYNEKMIYALLERKDKEHCFLSRSFEQNNAALDRVGIHAFCGDCVRCSEHLFRYFSEQN